MSPAAQAELQLVQSELDAAVADAIRRASTRSEHIRLTRIAVLVSKLKTAGLGVAVDETHAAGS